MGSAEIPSLLLAVRRHLWRQRAGDAVRVALWSTAALLLAAVALHLATRRVPHSRCGGWPRCCGC